MKLDINKAALIIQEIKMLKFLISAFLILNCHKIYAFDNKYTNILVDTNKLSLEHKKYQINYDPYFPGMEQKWSTKTNLYWDVRIYRIFWDNDLHMGMDQSQVRSVGWKYVIGIHVFDWLDLVKDHHSRHVLEETREYHFPVEDSYGLRVNFINKKEK